MVELPFDPQDIEELIVRLNAVMAREEADVDDTGGNPSDDEVPEMLQESLGDLSRDEIAEEIEAMNEDQQDALVALFWIGRGDADPEDWEETLAMASERRSAPVSEYLMSEPLAPDYLAEGLDRVQESGILDE